MKRIVLSLALLLGCCSCLKFKYVDTFKYVLINDSNYHIVFLLPERDPYWGWEPDLSAIDPCDTTLQTYGRHFSLLNVLPLSSHTIYSGYNSLEDIVPNDTIRLFIFDHSLYVDKIDNPEEFFASEEYLQRYDLTINDLNQLLDSKGRLVIRWPPDSIMKNMKMHPVYGYYSP